MRIKLRIGIAGIGLCLAGTAVPVVAHHAFSAEFDANKPIELTGTVTKMGSDQPARLAAYGREEARRHNRGVGFRGRDTERALPAGLHEGVAEARDRGQDRRLPGEGRHEARERPRNDVRRRQYACSWGRRARGLRTSWRAQAPPPKSPGNNSIRIVTLPRDVDQ